MKKTLLILLLLFNISCMNLDFFSAKLYKLSEQEREVKIENFYNSLNEKYYLLLENEIKEADRFVLEKKFQVLNDEIESLKNNSVNIKNLDFISKEHREFLEKYSKEIDLKLQYLKDLK